MGSLELRRITTSPVDDVVPSWSKDGLWIYFASHRTGSWQVFRAPAEGGEAGQITREGGYAAFEVPRTDEIVYTKFAASGLFRVARDGGPERQILDRPRCWGHFAVAQGGVYFLDSNPGQEPRVEFLDFTGGTPRRVASLGHNSPCVESSLAVSPDGRWLIYVGIDESSDIVRVDGIR